MCSCFSCALFLCVVLDMGVRAGLGEEFEGGEVGERVVVGVDVFGARPSFELTLQERVGLLGVDEIAR